ncbi:MAG: hypothetical protein V4486_00155 [Patescibacteria group bacterium]
MARPERGPTSLNLRNNKPEETPEKEGGFLRKDDAKLENLSEQDLNKMATGVQARLKAIEKALLEMDEKEKVLVTPPVKEIKKKEPAPVLAFVKPEEKEKKLSPENKAKLAKLRKERAGLLKIIRIRRKRNLPTSDMEGHAANVKNEISALENLGIDPDNSLDFFKSEEE